MIQTLTLRKLRSLGNIESYLKTARAELVSDPCDERLRASYLPVLPRLVRRGDLIAASRCCTSRLPRLRMPMIAASCSFLGVVFFVSQL